MSLDGRRTFTLALIGIGDPGARGLLELVDARDDVPIGRILGYDGAQAPHTFERGGSTHRVHRPLEIVDSLPDLDAVIIYKDLPDLDDVIEDIRRECPLVIDAAGVFEGDETVPLVVPTVTDHLTDDAAVLALPSPVAIALAILLAPIQARFGLELVTGTAMLSTGYLGTNAMDELLDQTVALINQRPVTPRLFAHRLCFAVHPAVGDPAEGETEDESRLHGELERLLRGTSQPVVHVSTGLVPAFAGDAVALTLRAGEQVDTNAVVELLEGNRLVDTERPPLPADAVGIDGLIAGRVRVARDDPRLVSLWIAFDAIGYCRAALPLELLLDRWSS